MNPPSDTGAGSLKCVVAGPGGRPLGPLLAAALADRLPAANVRPLPGDAVLIYTDASTADIREWLKHLLEAGEWLMILEFERWSARGLAAEAPWLLRRGH